MSPEDLLSLSLSQPLLTDHYSSMPRFLNVEDPVIRTSTPGTSGESASSDGKKKGKKKKRKGAAAEAVVMTKNDEEDVAVAHPSLGMKSSSYPDHQTETGYIPQVLEPGESDEEIQKESIIVNPWIPPAPVSPSKHSNHSIYAPSRPSTPISATNSSNSSSTSTSTPRRATPMQCQRPRATILSEYPLLSHIPSMIPAIPSIGDVRAAGRVTRDAGAALVGSVRDGYARRMKRETLERGKERPQRRMRRRSRRGSMDSSEESERSERSYEEEEGDNSDAEVLVDVEDAEGMAETSWRGVRPDGAALGSGWMTWRSCRWEQYGDRRLLISINPTPQTMLQITDCTSLAAQPSPMHMLHPETIDMGNSTVLQSAPFETLHIPRNRSNEADSKGSVLARDRLEVMGSVEDQSLPLDEGDEEVLVDCALLRPVDGPLQWLFLTILKRAIKSRAYGQGADSCAHQVFLSVFSTRTRKVERKMLVGCGIGGQVVSSSVAIVVTIAGQTPSIQFLSSETLQPIRRPVRTNIGVNTRTGLPVISLDGRFFAYASTDKRPTQPSQHGSQDRKLGTIVTAASNQAFHWHSDTHHRTAEPAPGSPSRLEALQTARSPTMQSIMLNTAAGLGSEVARGMWTGLKGLGTAAIQGASQSETLSKSAPALSSLAQRYNLPKPTARARDEAAESVPAREPQQQTRFTGGSWVKVLDLKATGSAVWRQLSDAKGARKLEKAKVVAHFALPASEVISVPHSVGSPIIDALSFSPGGTSLAVGTSDGRSSFIVEIRPAGTRVKMPTQDGEPDGEVWVRYELRRGMTPAVLERMEWSACGSWLGVGTRRTIHVFTIHPAGGRVSTQQIRAGRPLNPERIAPLSVKVSPVLRIRRPRGILMPITRASAPPSPGKVIAGETLVPNKSSACRVPARTFFFGPPVANVKHVQKIESTHGVLHTLNVFDPIKRILRSEAIFVSRDATTSSEAHSAKSDDMRLASSIYRAWKVPTEPYSFFVGGDVSAPSAPKHVDRSKAAPFANAEIQTYSTSPHILPRPIYRESWIRFSSIRLDGIGLPTEYQYRVTVDAVVPGHGPDVDLLRPLARAVEAQMDFHPSAPMIPALPNGSGREPSLWHTSFGSFAHARDIVRMRRKDSNLTSTSVTFGVSPASYGERVIDGADAGAMFDVGAGGVVGHEPDDMTNGSTSGDTRDDEWDDDLVTGVMDDELHHGAYPGHRADAANDHGQNGLGKKH